MTITTRQHVTDVFAVPVRNAEVATVAPPPVRECFARPIPREDEPEGATLRMAMPKIRQDLQDLVNEHSHHLCVCSPNREDMLRAKAEMQAHPGYAEYKARRDAAMGHCDR